MVWGAQGVARVWGTGRHAKRSSVPLKHAALRVAAGSCTSCRLCHAAACCAHSACVGSLMASSHTHMCVCVSSWSRVCVCVSACCVCVACLWARPLRVLRAQDCAMRCVWCCGWGGDTELVRWLATGCVCVRCCSRQLCVQPHGRMRRNAPQFQGLVLWRMFAGTQARCQRSARAVCSSLVRSVCATMLRVVAKALLRLVSCRVAVGVLLSTPVCVCVCSVFPARLQCA